MTPTLFQQVLGAPFFTMPEALRRLHASRGQVRYAGRATITRGRNPLARLCARIAGLPRAAADVPTTVEFISDAKGETWKRVFGSIRMDSRLWNRDGDLHERLGPLRLRYELHINEGALYWNVASVRVLGIVPLPAGLFSEVRCREREHEGRYEFLVEAALPLVGQVIRYEGWLAPA